MAARSGRSQVVSTKHLSVFYDYSKNRNMILTGRSYYDVSSFSKYLLPARAVTMIKAPTIIQPFSTFIKWLEVQKLHTGSVIWVLLEVLGYRFHSIQCFISLPQICFVIIQSLGCVRLLCNPLDCSPPWDFPGKNTGVVCHFPLQGIFLTQGSTGEATFLR